MADKIKQNQNEVVNAWQPNELPKEYLRAFYFFNNVMAEINAIKQYLEPLFAPFITKQDIAEVHEKVDDELAHTISDLSLAIERLGVYPAEDDLAVSIARLCKGVKNKREFFEKVAKLLK